MEFNNDKKIAKIGSYKGRINDLTISSDGRYLATASTDGTIKIWNVNSKTFVKTLIHKSMQYGYLKIKFSSNGDIWFLQGYRL